MNLSMEWLKDFVSVEDLSGKDLSDLMSVKGIEVEGIKNLGEGLKKIVVGYIEESHPHPNSDHLVITQVNVGEEVLQIVTGAPNVATGQKVIVALPNSWIAGHTKIKKGKMRGEISMGMLCSLQEIGYPESVVPKEYSEGIAVLPEDAPVGESVMDYLKMNDPILELDITPNRPDAFSMNGLAYEISAITNKELKMEHYDVPEEKELENFTLDLQDKENTPSYNAFMVKNVKIQPSPLDIQLRLMKNGIRPINNIVDATNYAMLLYGQPLHAFDYSKLTSQTILPRLAKEGEKIVTLDGEERELTSEDIVITDGEVPIAIAGVMGGESTKIDENTTTVLIEAATFNSSRIRRTARRLGLHSESSHRNERGVDVTKTTEAGYYAAKLIAEWGNGERVKAHNTIDTTAHQDVKISTTLSYVKDRLGIDLTMQDIQDIFSQLRFGFEEVDNDQFNVSVPKRRWDIEIPADLTEEIARIYGYDKIPSTLSNIQAEKVGLTPEQTFQRNIHQWMRGLGFDQIISYSLLSEEESHFFEENEEETIELSLPMSSDRKKMRKNLLSGLIKVMSYNLAHKQKNLSIYEIGKVFRWVDKEKEETAQPRHLAGLWSGEVLSKAWNEKERKVDFFDMKGVVEELLRLSKAENLIQFVPSTDLKDFHPGRSARLIEKETGQKIGVIGQLHPEFTRRNDLPETYGFEIDLEALFRLPRPSYNFKEWSKYPSIERDMAILIDEDVTNETIIKTIKEKGNRYLSSVDLFDLYQGEGIPEGKKSLAYRLVYINSNATLVDEEVSDNINEIAAYLRENLKAEIR